MVSHQSTIQLPTYGRMSVAKSQFHLTAEELRGSSVKVVGVLALSILSSILIGGAAFFVLPNPLIILLLIAASFVGLFFLIRPYAALLLLIFVIPFQFMANVSGDGAITLPKLLMPVVVIIWAVNHLVQRNARVVTAFFSHPFFIATFAFFLSLIPSLLYARSPGVFFFFFLTKLLPYFIIAVLLADMIRDFARLKQFFFIVTAVSLIVTGFGIIEVLTQVSILSLVGMDYSLVGGANGTLVSTKRMAAEAGQTAEWIRVASTFLDPNYFCGYMLLSMVGVLGYCRMVRSKLVLGLTITYCFMVAICVYSTGSRAGLLSFVIFGVSGLLFFSYPLKRLMLVSVAVAALAVLPFINHILGDSFRNGISVKAFYDDPRYGIWMTGKNMVEAHPVVGVGFGNYTERWHNFRHARARMDPFLPHNMTLGVLAETGLVGLFFFFLMLGLFCLPILGAWRLSGSSSKRFLIKLAGLNLVAFYAFSFTTNTIDFEFVWITMGATIALTKIPDGEFESVDNQGALSSST